MSRDFFMDPLPWRIEYVSRRRSDDLLDLVDAEYFHDDVRSRKMGGLDSGDRDMRRCYDESQALEVLAVDMGWVHGEKFCVTSPPKFYDKECYFQDFGFGPYLKRREPEIWRSIVEDPVVQEDMGDLLSPAFSSISRNLGTMRKEKNMANTIQKPEWTKVEGRNFFHRYSEFENQYGETWALLFDIEKDEILLSGSDVGWEVKSIAGKSIQGMNRWDAMEQITSAGARFALVMALEERMWVSACLRVAAEARENYLSVKK